MAGLTKLYTGDTAQIWLGTRARDVHLELKHAQDGVELLDTYTDDQLLTLFSITAGNAALLRAAYADVEAFWAIYLGLATQGTAHNYRQTIGAVFGPGAPTATGSTTQIWLSTLAGNMHEALKRAQDGVEFLGIHNDAGLLQWFNIANSDATILRASYADIQTLWDIYRGAATLGTVKNFRNSLGQIFGQAGI